MKCRNYKVSPNKLFVNLPFLRPFWDQILLNTLFNELAGREAEIALLHF
jgi:hypothetical protein